MGQYVIVIAGQGPHHNIEETGGPEADADRLGAAFVAKLKEAGHVIFDASLITTAGGGMRDNLET